MTIFWSKLALYGFLLNHCMTFLLHSDLEKSCYDMLFALSIICSLTIKKNRSSSESEMISVVAEWYPLLHTPLTPLLLPAPQLPQWSLCPIWLEIHLFKIILKMYVYLRSSYHLAGVGGRGSINGRSQYQKLFCPPPFPPPMSPTKLIEHNTKHF